MNHHSASLCEILNISIKNFLKYNGISSIYVNLNHSFGQGMLFYQAIDLKFITGVYITFCIKFFDQILMEEGLRTWS